MLYMYIHVHVVTGYQGQTIVSPYVGMAQTDVSCVFAIIQWEWVLHSYKYLCILFKATKIITKTLIISITLTFVCAIKQWVRHSSTLLVHSIYTVNSSYTRSVKLNGFRNRQICLSDHIRVPFHHWICQVSLMPLIGKYNLPLLDHNLNQSMTSNHLQDWQLP